MPGTYNLQIKCGNAADNFINIELKVKPFWYYTIWAFIGYIIILLLIAYLIFLGFLQKYKAKNLRNTQEAKNKLFLAIAHDLRSPINNYIGLTDNIKFLLQQKDYETIAAIGNEIDEKSRNLSLLLANIFQWGLMSEKMVTIQYSLVSIDKILNDILPAYKDIAKYKNINIVYTKKKEIEVSVDVNILSLILRNLIDNSIKYSTRNSNVEISADIKNDIFYFTVTDNITTTETSKLQELKKIFNSKNNVEPYDNNIGLGIAIIKFCCNLVNATVTIETENNTVSFCIMLHKL